MAKWGLCLALVLSGVVAAEAQSKPSGGAPSTVLGTILGRVTDPGGVPQAGVPVTITRRDGQFTQKVLTQTSGRFALPRLAPGVYSVEVLLPTFLPFWKAPIHVLPGAQVLLDINLRALADSLEVRWPENAADAREEWKWVLRSGAPPRHILRFQEETVADAATDLPEDPLRGGVQFSAGNGSRSFASDPGLQTSFDMEYGAGGTNSLGVAGLAGWEQGTPAAGFRAAWNRQFGNETSSSFSATLRQVFLPGEYWRGATSFEEGSGGRLQSVTVGYEHESAPSTRLRLHYGALVDSLSIGDHMTRWSPFGRVVYTHSDAMRLTFSYTGTAPRVLPSEGDPSQKKAERWLAIPQLSSAADLRPVLESGGHLEAAWEQELGNGRTLQAGVFYDSLSDVALSLAAIRSGGFAPGLLRDPFSNRYFLSGGNYAGPGARASLATKLTGNSEVAVGYSYAEGLRVLTNNLTAGSPQALREMVRSQRGHSFSVKVTSTVPGIDTQVITSYRWIPRYSVVAPDPYDQTIGRTEPYVNVVLLQPLPSPNILPGQFQAVVDISNLLAQGYLLVQTADGGKSLLFPAARSFRGGFNFIF